MNQKLTVYLDCGHGGYSPLGAYTTAPAKMYRHAKGEFHNGRTFYEGVFNRDVGRKLMDLIKADPDMEVMPIFDISLDWPLPKRISLANNDYKTRKLVNHCVGLSIHANASPQHTARGWEVYSSPGHDQSDHLAELLYDEMEVALKGKLMMRPDKTDGDHDKEAQFYVLRRSAMPFILSENGFFDDYDDAVQLIDPAFQQLLAEAHYHALMRYRSELAIL